MILPGETEAGTAGTQPCRGIPRWAHRDDERGREDSFLRRPTSIGSKDPHASKIPARRAEYSLTENVASPFQAEPRQIEVRGKRGFGYCKSLPDAVIPFERLRSRLRPRRVDDVLAASEVSDNSEVRGRSGARPNRPT